MSKILENYKGVKDVNKMSLEELNSFSKEIREFLIKNVSKTGGHLASNLGVVELTLSIFKVFNMERDKLIWDVGHQSYVHKLLTGRKSEFENLRNYGGISGFPKRQESPYDAFDTGHSSTSISAGIGMARARDLKKENYRVISVIGDGALTGGMALEALNDIGYNKTNMTIILNDNEMSIAKNVGGMSSYLNKLRTDPKYNRLKEDLNSTILKIPNVGKDMVTTMQRFKDGVKHLVVPGMFFEDIGIKYIGPIDGHDIKKLNEVLRRAKEVSGPVLVHVLTLKGKGYKFAEQNPNKFHGVGPFDSCNGECAASSSRNYSSVFGESMMELAKEDKDLVAVTAAMPDGTGLLDFSKKYKDRFFDVGIAEQHAVTLSAGMAAAGLKPVFAVYSTFLQRAYDQVVHDVCIQNLPVVFAIDRAGIVGQDGETHQGIFDISFLSHIPNMTIVSPKCLDEMKPLLKWSLDHNGPVAIRYPRGGDCNNLRLQPSENFSLGKWETIKEGKDVAIIATGKMVQHAMLAEMELKKENIDCGIINATFIKPIDKKNVDLLSKKYKNIVTIEDNVIQGGLGSTILQYLNSIGYNGTVSNLGYEDEFIPHGNSNKLYEVYGLNPSGIKEKILAGLKV